MTTLNITFTKPWLVAAAARWISTEQTRYYICGVSIQRAPQGGLYIVSTDGHRMSVGYDELGTIEDGTDNPAALFAVADKKHWTEFAKADAATITGDTVHFHNTLKGLPTADLTQWKKPHAVALADHIDGSFPDWAHVVPDMSRATASAASAFNPAYLADLGPMAKVLRCDGCARSDRAYAPSRVQITGITPDSPALIRFGSVSDWFGVLMPVVDRHAPSLAGTPDWTPEIGRASCRERV